MIGMPASTGLDPDRLEHVVRTHHPAMVYLIPTHHNPTGLVMPPGTAAAWPGSPRRTRTRCSSTT